MKYLNYKDGTGYSFDEYFDYLKSIREQLDSDTYSFASNWEHYSLDSKSSLHDSWMESISIYENSRGERNEIRNTNISITLLGPYHDQLIILKYENIFNYSIISGKLNGNVAGHGDLLMHEVQLYDSNHVSHEIQFSDGSIYLIVCEKINCEYKLKEK